MFYKVCEENDITYDFSNQKQTKSFNTLEEVLVENSTVNSAYLKSRLFKAGLLVERCYNPTCPNPEPVWDGKKLTLHLEHKDGNHRNNKIDNLEILCPNCHSQTSTYNTRKTEYTKTINTCSCGKEIAYQSINCKQCAGKLRKKKIDWPSDEELLEHLSKSNYSALARELGVSDNAIRKRLNR